MLDALRNFLLKQILKVPPDPETPFGALGSTKVFRAAKGFYTYRLITWLIKQVFPAIGIVAYMMFFSKVEITAFKFSLSSIIYLLEIFGILAYLVQIPLTLLMVKMDYELRWYIITDRSLRIREGLVHVQERTMSFANIQNLSIEQGPIQRLLGIKDLKVRTAGGGMVVEEGQGAGESMHVGYFRGVDNAEVIRDAIRSRVEKLKDSGLGDPDDDQKHERMTVDSNVLAAASSVLGEVKELRKTIARHYFGKK